MGSSIMKKKFLLLGLMKRNTDYNITKVVYSIALVILSILCLNLTGCSNNSSREMPKAIKEFFGDSLTIINSSNSPNGYKISIITNKDLCLCHFERGDTINQYFTLHKLPMNLHKYEDSIGVYSVKMEFPVLKVDTLGGSKRTPDMFFMDVNFDGEEEFIVEHEGYNRIYYACFDLVNGNNETSSPGLLESIQEEPYNNFVSSDKLEPSYTVFDYKKKEIYIYESSGCCSYHEIWAKCFDDPYSNIPNIKVVKQIKHEWRNGSMHVNVIK